MVERTWSDSGYLPSTDEYLDTGMISIAIHTMVLPASCFLRQSSPNQKLKPAEYAKITKLLMTAARLLNDTQSYQVKSSIVLQYLLQLIHLFHNELKVLIQIAFSEGTNRGENEPCIAAPKGKS
jgi:hypothetical protein